MRARIIGRALTICLALSLSAGVAVAFGATVFLCRVDSVVRFECCCAAGLHGIGAGGGDRIQGASCCDLVQGRLPMAEAVTPPAQESPTSVIATVTLFEPTSPLCESATAAVGARAVSVGIPARLQKHSLLL